MAIGGRGGPGAVLEGVAELVVDLALLARWRWSWRKGRVADSGRGFFFTIS